MTPEQWERTLHEDVYHEGQSKAVAEVIGKAVAAERDAHKEEMERHYDEALQAVKLAGENAQATEREACAQLAIEAANHHRDVNDCVPSELTASCIAAAIRARTPSPASPSAQNGPPADPAPGQTSDAPHKRSDRQTTFPCCGAKIPLRGEFPNQKAIDPEFKRLTYDCPKCGAPLIEDNLVISARSEPMPDFREAAPCERGGGR